MNVSSQVRGLPPQLVRAVALALVFCFGNACASGQVTNLPPISHGLPEMGYSVFRMLGALALVLALFLAGVWGFKHWQRLAIQKGRPPKLQIVEVKALGNRHALYVVAYEQQRLLLASSPGGLSLVTHLPEASAEETVVPLPSFTQALQQAISARS